MDEMKILIFNLGKEFYATDISEVERILGSEKTTKLPDSPSFLEGVIDYEEGILPVINLVKRFNKSLEDNFNLEDKKIIVVKKEFGKIGILVDNVSEVLSIGKDEVNNPKTVSSLVSKEYMRGFIRKNDNIVIMLDLDKILSTEEEAMLFQGWI